VDRYDAIVVGGGLVGCSTAYHLARGGSRVALLEREHVAWGASGRNTGFVWVQGRNPGFGLDVGLAARKLYEELEPEVGPFGLRVCGGLVFFVTPEQGRVMDEYVAARNADGLEMELIDAADVRRLVPPIREDVLGAAFCPHDLFLDTPRFVQGLADAAGRHGADIREGVAAREVVLDGGRAVGVRTDDGVLEAGTVVVAAGAWTRELLGSLELELPLGVERIQVVATEPVDTVIEPVVYGPLAAKQYDLFRSLPSWDERDFTADFEDPDGVELLELLAQRPDGSVWLGCPMDYPTELDMRPTVAGVAAVTRAIAQDFPGLRDVAVDRTWACLLAFTSDTCPIIDEALPGLVIASGHIYGNAAGPMTGKLIAQMLAGEEPELDLSECRLERGLELVAAGTVTRW
jgi:glycine/D-amino acid oxidase-like deaminating enzyme